MIILGNIDIIKTGDAEIQNDIKNERKIKQRKVKSEVLRMNRILPGYINENNMKRLNKQIQEKEKGKIGDKFFLYDEFNIGTLDSLSNEDVEKHLYQILGPVSPVLSAEKYLGKVKALTISIWQRNKLGLVSAHFVSETRTMFPTLIRF